jgi:3-dehydrosphinganine reductase
MKNQNILITGGSSGLGLSLAKSLAPGNRLLLIARDLQKLEQAKIDIQATAPGAEVEVEVRSIDIMQPEAEQQLIQVIDRFGGVDLLINSAGILREGYFEDLGLEDFRSTMDINFFGTLSSIRAALPSLKARQGRVLNVASIAGLTGVFGYAAYCSSKHALIGLTEALSFELKPMGVGIQVACPPEFDSPMVDALDQTRTPENRAHVLMIPKMSLEDITAGILRGMQSSELIIIPGAQSKLMAFGLRHFPTISRMMAHAKIKSAKTKNRESA